MLDEVGFHQVIEDVVFTNPLHRAAAGRAKRRALHPARVAGSTKDMHARLQAKAKTTLRKNQLQEIMLSDVPDNKKNSTMDNYASSTRLEISPDTVMQ